MNLIRELLSEDDPLSVVRATAEKIGATHFFKGIGYKTEFFKKDDDGAWMIYQGGEWKKDVPHRNAQWKPVAL